MQNVRVYGWLVWLIFVTPVMLAAQTIDLLPDLAIKRLGRFFLQTTEGKRLLRFPVVIVNIGDGNFEIRGKRRDINSPWDVDQIIFNSNGGWRRVQTEGTLVWGGDGHRHLHLYDLEKFVLVPLNGSKERRGAKRGFCFYDNKSFGSNQPPFYTSKNACSSGKPSTLRTRMGLSVGWGDSYARSLPDQYVDITGLPKGDYTLAVSADPANWFQETNENNNTTWVDLRISSSSTQILRHGPAPKPVEEQAVSMQDELSSHQVTLRAQGKTAGSKGTFAAESIVINDSTPAVLFIIDNIEHETYKFSGHVYIGATAEAFTATIVIRWMDDSGNTLRVDEVAFLYAGTDEEGEAIMAEVEPPSGARSGTVVIRNDDSQSIQLTDLLFEPIK